MYMPTANDNHWRIFNASNPSRWSFHNPLAFFLDHSSLCPQISAEQASEFNTTLYVGHCMKLVPDQNNFLTFKVKYSIFVRFQYLSLILSANKLHCIVKLNEYNVWIYKSVKKSNSFTVSCLIFYKLLLALSLKSWQLFIEFKDLFTSRRIFSAKIPFNKFCYFYFFNRDVF